MRTNIHKSCQLGLGLSVALLLVGSVLASDQFEVDSSLPLAKTRQRFVDDIVSTNKNDVRFFLYHNPKSMEEHSELELSNTSIKASHYAPEKTVKIIIHGFLGDFKAKSSQEIKNAYLQFTGDNYNIICVDWSTLSTPKLSIANFFFYGLAASNTPIAGRRVAEFIIFLIEKNFTIASNIHVIGFSLGVHVASNAGKYFRKMTNSKFARISGLDPSKSALEPSKTLSSADADFVDVTHTSGQLGLQSGLGHIDFYPYGGKYQKGCELEIELDNFMSLIDPISGLCSHNRAPTYFAKSINPARNITACKCVSEKDDHFFCNKLCDHEVVFGERCSETARGHYYLEL